MEVTEGMMDATRSHGTVQNALAIPISKPEKSPDSSYLTSKKAD